MNWSKLWYVLSLLGIASLLFTLGFAVGNRVFDIAEREVSLKVKHWNGSTITALNSVRLGKIFSRTSEGEVRQVGTLLLYEQDKSLDFVLQIDQMPLTFNLSDKQFAIPTTLQIYLVAKDPNGLEYNSRAMGSVNIVQKDNKLTGRFPGSIDESGAVKRFERFIFMGPTGSSELPPGSSLEFLPASVRDKPAPYGWSEQFIDAK